MISRGEYKQWLEHPVTVALLGTLDATPKAMMLDWVNGVFDDELEHKETKKHAAVRAEIRAYSKLGKHIVDGTFLPLEEEEEDK